MPIKPECFPDRFPEDAFIQQNIDPNSIVRCPYDAGEIRLWFMVSVDENGLLLDDASAMRAWADT